MSVFLIRSFADPRSFTPQHFPQGVLPRTSAESYVPWALTADRRVVYARTGEHTGWRGGSAGLRPYDSLVSQDRRRLAESALGLMALDHPQFTAEGVGQVNLAIQKYLDHQLVTNRAALTKELFAIGQYFYTGGGTGLGRIDTLAKAALGPDGVRKGIFNALARGRLDQKLSIHDAIGRKVLSALGGEQLATYNHWGPILRQDWFDDAAKRGRKPAAQRAGATSVGGIVRPDQAGAVGTTAIARGRGVDMFQRDTARTRQPEADAYYDDVDTRNLLFGAGISGTTGSLLQSAFAFAGVFRGEPLKQYVLAIVGYLVGGGMHSYHESMAVASKAGLPYNPGAYASSLPQAFLGSMQYAAWRTDYYDIVELGATHWRHNAGALPSHLNRQLTPS